MHPAPRSVNQMFSSARRRQGLLLLKPSSHPLMQRFQASTILMTSCDFNHKNSMARYSVLNCLSIRCHCYQYKLTTNSVSQWEMLLHTFFLQRLIHTAVSIIKPTPGTDVVICSMISQLRMNSQMIAHMRGGQHLHYYICTPAQYTYT